MEKKIENKHGRLYENGCKLTSDLIDNICHYFFKTNSISKTEEKFGVDKKTIKKYLRENIIEKKHNYSKNFQPKMDFNIYIFIDVLILNNPTLTQEEIIIILKNELDIEISQSYISKILKYLLKKSYKVVSNINPKRISDEVLSLRDNYIKFIKLFKIDNLIWIDETHFEFGDLKRNKGYFNIGEESYIVQNTERKECLSLIAAINNNSTLHYQYKYSTEGSIKSDDFIDFLFNIEPFCDGKILIMDNCPIHHEIEVKFVIKLLKLNIIYLPPYSPDMQPIELFFNNLKTLVRKSKLDYVEDLITRIINVIHNIPSENYYNFVRSTGVYYEKNYDIIK
jgi:transposase